MGLKNSDTMISLTMTSSGAGASARGARVGTPDSVVPSAAVFAVGASSNYSISYVNGTLAVTPAPLTITAKYISKQYGLTYTPVTTNPGDFTVTGLKNSDTITSVSLSSSGYAA